MMTMVISVLWFVKCGCKERQVQYTRTRTHLHHRVASELVFAHVGALVAVHGGAFGWMDGWTDKGRRSCLFRCLALSQAEQEMKNSTP